MRVSRSLLTIIDEAIIPALLVFAAKFVGLVTANWYYSLTWDSPLQEGFLPLFHYRSGEAFAMANTFSNFVVFAVVLAGFVWVLIRAHTLHDSHIAPRLSVRLVSLDMTGLIASSWKIYHHAVIWLCYLWLTVLLFVLQSVYGVTPWWLPAAAAVIGLNLTWFFVVDVEREIALGKERS